MDCGADDATACGKAVKRILVYGMLADQAAGAHGGVRAEPISSLIIEMSCSRVCALCWHLADEAIRPVGDLEKAPHTDLSMLSVCALRLQCTPGSKWTLYLYLPLSQQNFSL